LIDALLDDLYETLFLGPDGPLISSRMALAPDRDADSLFVAAPRPTTTRDDMAAIAERGLWPVMADVLDDLPDHRREEVLAKLKAITDVLIEQAHGDGPAEPSSLVYALH